MMLSKKRLIKALIRLRGCAGWSSQAGLRLCCSQIPEDRFSYVKTHIETHLLCVKSNSIPKCVENLEIVVLLTTCKYILLNEKSQG